MRPSSSSSPQSPHVEPGGRCFHRFATLCSLLAALDRRRASVALLVPTGWFSMRTRVAPASRGSRSASRPGIRSSAGRSAGMTQKELVVSADGHILEPTDLFRTRLPKHLRDRGVWEEDFEIEPLVEGGRPDLPAPAHARVRGLDDLPLPPDRRADARGRPRHDPRGHGPRRGRRRRHAPEPVAVRALLRRPRAVDGPRPCLQRLHHRAVHAVLLAHRPHRPDSHHRHRRRRGRDRAGRRRRVPGHPAAGDAAQALLLAGLRPGVGGGPGQRRARVHPHPDRRGEGQRPGRPPRSRWSWSRPRRSTSR